MMVIEPSRPRRPSLGVRCLSARLDRVNGLIAITSSGIRAQRYRPGRRSQRSHRRSARRRRCREICIGVNGMDRSRGPFTLHL
jgi:hypothetical protein